MSKELTEKDLNKSLESLKIDMSDLKAIKDKPKIIEIQKSLENSSKFDEIIKLKKINDELKLKQQNIKEQISTNEKLFQKTIRDFHQQEKFYHAQVKFYQDQWHECNEKFNAMKMFVDNVRNLIREEELNEDQEVVEEWLRTTSIDREE